MLLFVGCSGGGGGGDSSLNQPESPPTPVSDGGAMAPQMLDEEMNPVVEAPQPTAVISALPRVSSGQLVTLDAELQPMPFWNPAPAHAVPSFGKSKRPPAIPSP